jgi:hypothetical protein
VTDEEGARILVDELQLPFEHVSTALDAVADENPNWWALGKIEAALRIVRDRRNRRGWRELPGKHMLLVEQYLLGAMIEYHRCRQSLFRIDGINYVFPEIEDAFVPERATEAGYTHLIGGAKRNPQVAERLERRVEREYPECYERIVKKTASV